MVIPVARVRLAWFSEKEGGRKSPFQGFLYATTARFAEAPAAELFSVALSFPNATQPNPVEGTLRLLAPDLLPQVRARLVPGTHLEITEGLRPVARCEVVAVKNEDVQSTFTR